MQRLALFLMLVLLCVPLVRAQGSNDSQFPKYEIYAGYLDSGEFPYNVFRFPVGNGAVISESDFGTHHGFDASFTRNFAKYIGIKGDFSAHFHHDEGTGNFMVACGQTTCVVSQPVELTPRLFNFLGGPEFKLRNHTRFTPLAYGLFGVAHTTSTFKTSGSTLNLSLNTTETGFAMAFGGGLDIRITRRISFRMTTDFNPKWVGRNDNGARQVQNDLRFSVGILFH
jgi:opacity protein-like surface antigen